MAKKNKKNTLLIIAFIILMIAVIYLNKERLGINTSKVSDIIIPDSVVVSNNDQVSEIKANKDKIDKILKETKDLLQKDQGFLNNLHSYISLPMTEDEYKFFIGTVHNDYPFGNPINEKNKE